MHREPNRSATGVLVGSLALGLSLLSGCRAGGPTPADALREENLRLKTEVEKLTGDVRELTTKLSERLATLSTDPARALSPEAAQAMPRVASIEIDMLSGPVADSQTPAGSDGRRTVAIYVRPLDGRGRFLQATGTLNVEIARLESLGGAAGGTPATADSASSTDAPARVLTRATLQPLALREAYRSGFTGTYYVVELSVPAADLAPPGQLLLRATLEDAVGLSRHDASRVVALR